MRLDVPLYGQRDKRWRAKKLGFGFGTIGVFGCILADISMMLDFNPDKLNDSMRKNGCFTGASKNLVNWRCVANNYPFTWQGKKSWRNVPADLNAIANYIDQRKPVILETKLPATNPRDWHFVLAIGYVKEGGEVTDIIINDPWYSKSTLYTSLYSKTPEIGITGCRLLIPDKSFNKYQGNMTTDQSTELAECLKQHNQLMKEIATLKVQLDDERDEVAKVAQKWHDVEAERDRVKDEIKATYKPKIKALEGQIVGLERRVENLIEQAEKAHGDIEESVENVLGEISGRFTSDILDLKQPRPDKVDEVAGAVTSLIGLTERLSKSNNLLKQQNEDLKRENLQVKEELSIIKPDGFWLRVWKFIRRIICL